jgi:hypothetical protein
MSKLDDEQPKSPWESATIRATAKGAAATGLAIALRVGGQNYDVPLMQDLVGMGADLLLSLLSLWWYYKAAKGRIDATQTIERKKP